jgi:hypothetical protein
MLMADSDFVILKREGQTPSLAMCQRCKVKFFTPPELTDKRNEAEDFLWGRFFDHKCRVVTLPSRTHEKAVNQ